MGDRRKRTVDAARRRAPLRHDDGGPDGEPVINIDDNELSWEEFGRLLTTHAGWGMRIVFVPDDKLHETPRIEVREPETR